MVIAVSAFLSMNASLYTGLSMEQMRNESTPAVVRSPLQIDTVMELSMVQKLAQYSAGVFGASIVSLAIATSAMGTLNANVFATGRLCMAAAQRGYSPAPLANLHVDIHGNEDDYHQRVLRKVPAPISRLVLWLARRTSTLRLKQEVPL